MQQLTHTLTQNYEKGGPEFARKLPSYFYVDDLNTGVCSVEDGFKLYKKMKINLMDGSFNVRKWRANSEKLCNLIYNCEKSFGGKDFILLLKMRNFLVLYVTERLVGLYHIRMSS